MQNFIMLFILLLLAGGTTGQSRTPDPLNYHIRNTHIVDARTGQILENRDVFIKDGKIIAIRDAQSRTPPGEWQEIDGTGKYLMPGITEMHAHIPVRREGDDQNVRETLFLYLSNGITTIRGMLGNPYHLELKRLVQQDKILSPRIYTSSPSMNGNSVQSPEEAIVKVTQYWEDGYDFLKIHPGIKLPVMEALVNTAKQLGMTFSGHIPYDVGIENALKFGYASIDHADGYIEGMMPAGTNFDAGGFFGSNFARDVELSRLAGLCRQTAEQKIWVVPTQSLFTRWVSPDPPEEMIQAPEMQYMPASVRYSWVQGKTQILNNPEYSAEDYQVFLKLRKRILKSLYDAQVGFLLGSDAPQVFNVPGFSAT